MSELQIWHGSRRWDGWPEIRASKKDRYEFGPGIYCTTNLNTATKYSKGGGRIVRFTLDPEITWLEDAKVPFELVQDFVRNSKHIGKRRILADDLSRAFDKHEHLRNSGEIPLTYLVNLAINNECLSGKGGPEMAEYLVDNGVMASLYRKSVNDDWVVIFDTRAILKFEPLTSKQIDWQNDELPSIRDQIAALSQAPVLA